MHLRKAENIIEAEMINLPYREELGRGMERRIENCINIMKEIEMDKGASLVIEKLLSLVRINLKSGNYEDADKRLRNAERIIEAEMIKNEDKESNLRLVKGVAGVCFGCGEKVDAAKAVFKCTCGCIYHEECVIGLDNCPGCHVEWK
ncbi:MAG: hypothetical protein AB1779_05775 [Candidatus Thermoplasmatota archaeon]